MPYMWLTSSSRKHLSTWARTLASRTWWRNLFPEPLPPMRALHEPRDVDERDRGGDDLFRLEDPGELSEPLVGHGDGPLVRVDRAERVVRRLRARMAERVHERGFAHVRKTDYSDSTMILRDSRWSRVDAVSVRNSSMMGKREAPVKRQKDLRPPAAGDRQDSASSNAGRLRLADGSPNPALLPSLHVLAFGQRPPRPSGIRLPLPCASAASYPSRRSLSPPRRRSHVLLRILVEFLETAVAAEIVRLPLVRRSWRPRPCAGTPSRSRGTRRRRTRRDSSRTRSCSPRSRRSTAVPRRSSCTSFPSGASPRWKPRRS